MSDVQCLSHTGEVLAFTFSNPRVSTSEINDKCGYTRQHMYNLLHVVYMIPSNIIDDGLSVTAKDDFAVRITLHSDFYLKFF